jgi:pilus assembly protein CpaB
MDSKKVMLLIGALLLAAVSAFMVKSTLSNGGPSAQAMGKSPEQAGPEVLVATRALPVGTLIEADSFRYQPWPKDLVEKAYFLKGESDLNALVGTVVRYPVTAGQPITQGALVKPGDRGFLAAALGPGMRAVTVPVSAQSGVAGFVFPGDRIDLLLAQDVPGGGDGMPLKASETIVRNLRVLATDQRTDKTEDENGKTIVTTFSTVTLEATPKIAEKIAVAQTMGQMSLSLRSIADNNAELERAIASGEVTMPETDDPKKERQVLLAIANRPVDTNTTFTVGGDVSRFQRRTVPGRASDNQANGAERAVRTASAGASTGPVIRIARGNNVTEITVGGK